MAQKKTYQAPLELKSDGKGSFEAVFATLGPAGLDKDGDLTEHGAFGEQLVTVEGWGHDMGLPVGKGRIFERGDEARVTGSFFMDTTAGRDHYQVVKNLGPQTEWSYTFQILKSEPGRGPEKRRLLDLEVHGVSPVTRGAGEGTRTVRLKSAGSDTPDLGRIKAGGYDFGPYISENPAAALRQLRYAAVEISGEPLGGPRIPYDPGEARKVLALESGDPGELKALLEDELFKAAVSEIEGKLDGDTAPTNFDRLREQVRRAFGSDVSEQYVTTMARAHLADLVAQAQRNDSTITPRQARQQVARWARQAAT